MGKDKLCFKRTEASLEALDMPDKGLLKERAALAVIGTHEESYRVVSDVQNRANEHVEIGNLSKRGLVAILVA